jgi:hypothetical protein
VKTMVGTVDLTAMGALQVEWLFPMGMMCDQEKTETCVSPSHWLRKHVAFSPWLSFAGTF